LCDDIDFCTISRLIICLASCEVGILFKPLAGDQLMSKWNILISIPLLLFSLPAYGDEHDWKEKQIKDALLAAPPVITDNATVYG